MKIQWKIFYCLFTVVFFLLVIVGFTYSATAKVSYFRNRALAVEGRLLSATFLRAAVRNQLLETIDVLFVSGNGNNHKRIDHGKDEVQKRLAELNANFSEASFDHTAYASDLVAITESYAVLQNALDEGVSLLKQGRAKEAQQVLTDARTKKFEEGFLVKISAIIDKERNASELVSANLGQSISRMQKGLLFSAGAALLLSLLLSMYVARSIGRRLARIESAAQKMSARDFNISLPIEGNDEVTAVSRAINHMASSLREAKSQIGKQQELLIVSSKMSSLGEMASGIAHEINTPLAVIALRVALLKEASKKEDFAINGRKMVEESSAIIERTAHRIAKIITGLRAFARDGTADPLETIDIQSVISDTMGLCGEKFRNSGVELTISMPEAPLNLACRSTQISQVLLNLLSNSFDAVQPLTEKWIRLDVSDLGASVQLSVTDSGSGITPEVRAKLAQPFFTTKDVGKGTGLGLSISRGIVMDHGGELILDEQNKNTRFIVVLPKNL